MRKLRQRCIKNVMNRRHEAGPWRGRWNEMGSGGRNDLVKAELACAMRGETTHVANVLNDMSLEALSLAAARH